MSQDHITQDHIRYDVLTQDALRGVVRKVLSEVEKAGLPGDHHFFISFATRAPGVRISKKLLDQYQEEMTIVIQNQYRDLKVSESAFEIGLAFDGIPEMLVIPFTALKGFFDPSVEFALQFEPSSTDMTVQQDEEPVTVPETTPAPEKSADQDVESPAEKVVSLDSFRKK